MSAAAAMRLTQLHGDSRAQIPEPPQLTIPSHGRLCGVAAWLDAVFAQNRPQPLQFGV